MTKRPNLPNEIYPGKTEYSWRSDLKVNGWLIVATMISAFADILCFRMVEGWPVAGRTAIAFAQFAAIALWARNLARWIGGMDELHRRVTGSAVLFAIGATFFIIMLWHRLDAAGLFRAIFPGRGSWDIATVTHAFLLMTLFYFTGFAIFNRRYQ